MKILRTLVLVLVCVFCTTASQAESFSGSGGSVKVTGSNLVVDGVFRTVSWSIPGDTTGLYVSVELMQVLGEYETSLSYLVIGGPARGKVAWLPRTVSVGETYRIKVTWRNILLPSIDPDVDKVETSFITVKNPRPRSIDVTSPSGMVYSNAILINWETYNLPRGAKVLLLYREKGRNSELASTPIGISSDTGGVLWTPQLPSGDYTVEVVWIDEYGRYGAYGSTDFSK